MARNNILGLGRLFHLDENVKNSWIIGRELYIYIYGRHGGRQGGRHRGEHGGRHGDGHGGQHRHRYRHRERVCHGVWLIGPKLFRPEAYSASASSKLCEFIL